MIKRTTRYNAITVQMIRHGEQDDVEHDPVRQESSLDFIRGSVRCSESVVFDVMCLSKCLVCSRRAGDVSPLIAFQRVYQGTDFPRSPEVKR